MDSVRAPNHQQWRVPDVFPTTPSDTQQSMYRTLEWSLDSFYVNVSECHNEYLLLFVESVLKSRSHICTFFPWGHSSSRTIWDFPMVDVDI